MFISMVIKEIKLFSRNKGSVLMMFAFPIILITILGFSLESMMSGATNFFDDSKVLYKIEDSSYEEGFNSFKDTMTKEFPNLEFQESIADTKSKELVSNNDAIAFITISQNGYYYYRNEIMESQSSKIFRSIFEGVINQYALMDVVIKNDPSLLTEITSETTKEYINEATVGSRAVSSVDYYTFAELALIILYVSSIVGESVVNEKDLGTLNRIKLTNTSTFKIIISKITLGLVIVSTQIITVYFYSTIVLGANWGNNILPMILNLISLGLFASVLGAIIGMIIKDGKSLNGILNIIIIVLCLFGGCYTPLAMIKGIPVLGDLAVISPIYWINSALTSLSTGVTDTYSSVSLSMTLGFSAFIIFAYIIINKLKGRGKVV